MDQASHEDERTAQPLGRRQRRALARAAAKGRKHGAGAALSGAALALVGLGFGGTADAATFNVTNLNDSGPGSLRQAVLDANSSGGADVITFQAGLTGTITLTTGQLQVYASVDIQGPGADVITVSGNDASRVFYLYADSAGEAVTISGLTVSHGNATEGGGIYDKGEGLTLDHVVLTTNAAGDGGGLGLGGVSPTVTVRDSTITGNQATGSGGGVYVGNGDAVLFQRDLITNNQATKGGGAYFYDPASVTFEDSTISGNTANSKGGGIYLYDTNGAFTVSRTTISGNTAANSGGGIYLYQVGGPMTIVDSTVSGNTATAGSGGGLFLYSLYNGSSIQSSTIANNTSTVDGGGIYLYSDELSLVDTIVADNTSQLASAPPNGVKALVGNDLGGGTFDLRYSLIENQGTATVNDNGGNIFNQDPQLGPLANNGGPTQTQRPALTSPAVDHGDPAFTPPPATDQRGFPRVANARIDIGSVELTPGVDFDIETVPTLGDVGKLLLAGLLAGGGLLLMRRRRGLIAPIVPMLALAVTLAGFQAADAAPRSAKSKPPKEVTAGALLPAQIKGAAITLRLAGGTSLTVPVSLVQIKDRRHHPAGHPGAVPALAALPADQPVVIKVRHGADGSIKAVKLQLFDTLTAAQASLQARDGH
jgi:hypothetical protein